MLNPVNAQRDQCLLETQQEALSTFAAREIQPDTRKTRVTATEKELWYLRTDQTTIPASLLSEKGMD